MRGLVDVSGSRPSNIVIRSVARLTATGGSPSLAEPQALWTRYYTEGSVIVDFIDTRTKQLVWRGVATDTIKSAFTGSDKTVDRGARELVKHLLKDAGGQEK